MKLKGYLKDKLYEFVIVAICLVIVNLIFFAFKIGTSVIISISVIFTLCFIILLFIDYFRKKIFYDELLSNVKLLDKSYYVLETIQPPTFYEGKLIYQSMYEINKSMTENINNIEEQRISFKEYIEMWIHEVKIPLSSLILILNNSKNKISKNAKEQLKRLEDYVEQVLYYARSENAEKDYLIKETNLKSIIKNIGLKNMDNLLEEKIEFIVKNVDVNVYTDSKWIEFILGQIINNSIKYKKDGEGAYIKIYVVVKKDKTTLVIEDNGIGIKDTDIRQVFNKTFTGENGRKRTKSTGMGLFIAKNLCERLGHDIDIESIFGEYTKVMITFAKNRYYEVLK